MEKAISQTNKSEKPHEWSGPIKDYLDNMGLAYEAIFHEPSTTLLEAAKSCGVHEKALIKSVFLQDSDGFLMVVMPAVRLLDFNTICQLTDRELVPVPIQDIAGKFKDCEPGSFPPLPNYFQIEGVVDASVLEQAFIYIEPGQHQFLLKLPRESFLQLIEKTPIESFTAPVESLTYDKEGENIDNIVKKFTPHRIKDRLDEIFDLPTIPPMADAILKLRVDPNADSKKLAQIIEKDPSLAAQLMSWAQSPFYGFAGKIESIEDAIVKVLGFDLVMNLALGLAVGRSMRIPNDGPLGLKAFWRFSLYTAILTEKLSMKMPSALRPPRGLAYLSGLLHNFGHMILGQVFPPQFYILNQYILVNEDVPILTIENHVLGVTHTQIGAWLMQAWAMPQEIIATIKFHHEGDFTSSVSVYPNLVLLAIRLLKSQGIGDAECTQCPKPILDAVDLNAALVESALEEVLAHQDEIEHLSKQLLK